MSASRTTETISETNDGGECFLIFRYFLVIFLLFTTLWEPIRALLLAANGRAGTSWQLEAWDIRCKCLKFARVVPLVPLVAVAAAAAVVVVVDPTG